MHADNTPRRLCVIGLGNPGPRYAWTRHNIGFMIVDRLAGRLSACELSVSSAFWAAHARRGESEFILCKPLTYMNRSGAVIDPLLQRFGIDFTEFLVIHDDVHLPTGVLRLRCRGSSGGHNGLSSILEATGSRNIARLRVGVGISSSTADLVEHVLSPFEREELPLIDTVLDKAADAVFVVLESGWDKAMNVYNTIQTNNQDAS